MSGDPPKLLDRVRAAIRTRHYSRRTEEAYVGWIRRYILHQRELTDARWQHAGDGVDLRRDDRLVERPTPIATFASPPTRNAPASPRRRHACTRNSSPPFPATRRRPKG